MDNNQQGERKTLEVHRTKLSVIVIKESDIPGCVVVSYGGHEYHVSKWRVKDKNEG